MTEEQLRSVRPEAPGWDPRYLEQQWRAWVLDKAIPLKNPTAHFKDFCRRWYAQRGRPN